MRTRNPVQLATGGTSRKLDFDRMAALNTNAHRLSLEWSRIQTQPDHWDAEALERYRVMIQQLLQQGIEPKVTLHHFTLLAWMYERGGWENDHSLAWFFHYVRKVVRVLRDWWISGARSTSL